MTAKDLTVAARAALQDVRKFADYAEIALRAGSPDAALSHIERASEALTLAADLSSKADRTVQHPVKLVPPWQAEPWPDVCVGPLPCRCDYHVMERKARC